MHSQLTSRYVSKWYLDPAFGLDSNAGDTMDGLLRRGKGPTTSGRFVESMSLCFWVRLLGHGSHIDRGGKADHERTLWRPALFLASQLQLGP